MIFVAQPSCLMGLLFLLNCSTLSSICSIYDGVFVGIHWFLVIS